MKIAVLIKRVPDTASVIKVAGDGKSIDTASLKYVLSPYDEHAVEQAVQIKEAGEAEVIVVSAGAEASKETMRVALAMGADSGILVKDDGFDIAGSKGVAKALAGALKDLGADMILAGKQAVDDDGAQVAERVAELLEVPHVSVVTKLDVQGDKASAVREIEGGSCEYEVTLPAVFTAQKGLNTPRYPALPMIMKAKKKEIKELGLSDVGLSADDLTPGYEVVGLTPPPERSGGTILEGDNAAADLVKVLHEEKKVI